MAKLTPEQAKAELAKLEGAIGSLKAANVDVPPVLQEQFDRLTKQLQGNASNQVAEILNSAIAPAFEKPNNAELKANIAKAIGTKVRVTIAIDKDGKVVFEAAGSAATGGGGGTGVTRGDSQFNHWAVDVLNEDGSVKETAEHESASAALDYILNEGKNPMNLPATFGKGNSAVRVLTGILPKNPLFAKNFKVTGSKVEKAKAEPATAPAAEPAK